MSANAFKPLSLIFLGAVFFGCTAKVDKQTNSGVSTQRYNELVQRYNDLLEGSHAASEAQVKSDQQMQTLNSVLTRFASNADAYINGPEASPAQMTDLLTRIRADYNEGLIHIAAAEILILKEMDHLEANADRVYKNGKTRFTKLQQKSATLEGLSAEHRLIMKAVGRRSVELAGRSGTAVPPAQPVPPSPSTTTPARPPEQNQIILQPTEREVGRVTSGGGIYRDKAGGLSSATPGQFQQFAREKGFDATVAGDSFHMASKNNGVVGLACSNQDLIVVLNDLVSHMKTKMNLNSDDLELAFAIDYSGSMSNNIKYVLDRIVDFAQNLENIKAAGRGVKVAIVTFGMQGREKVELPLTADLAKFRTKLKELLELYQANTHSTNPGEAIYMGLEMLLKEIPFTSQNRQIVAITDEPSWELQTNQDAIVNRVDARLKNFNLYPLVVRYCD